MKANKEEEIFVPDRFEPTMALARTTHLAVAAHPDDIEIMAPHGVLACYQNPDLWFTGAIVTDGRSSPRDFFYKDRTDEQMRLIRREEQKRAAQVGEYASMVFLDYSSESINKGKNIDLIESLVDLVQKTSPDIIYTHNPADKHDTHVSVTLHTINALRLIEKEKLPKKIYGCELWRNLDWMLDQDKIIADVSRQENLQLALIGVFDSQISGGKRYDLATIGRRKANATFYQIRSHDDATSLVYEMDLTPLIKNSEIQIEQYIDKYIERFRHDVLERIRRLS